MPGDGVSLPTTLAQMGSVAKTQARTQQAAPQVTPFSEQKDEKNELKVQRVKETTKAEKSRVAADQDEKDKRKRRRLKRHRLRFTRSADDTYPGPDQGTDQEDDGPEQGIPQEEETLGCLIDMRV